MKSATALKIGALLGRAFPEQRLFLRSDSGTRFVRLSPLTQIAAVTGTASIVGWSIICTAILLMDTIGSGNVRDQVLRDQALYEERLNALAVERDSRADEARAAHERFTAALTQVSQMQSTLLESEARRRELETGIDVTQDTLRRTLRERDTARGEAATLAGKLEKGGAGTLARSGRDGSETTLDYLTAALSDTAAARDAMADKASEATAFAEEQILEARLKEDRNDMIFSQIEDALTISVAPLDKMFRDAGLSTDKLLDTVRRGYSGLGGPATPVSFSTKGEGPDADSLRATSILSRLDEMNLYRIAAEKTPFALPLKTSFRYTSGFGRRWGRMHEGTDMAGASGSPILATAEGTISYAGRMSGYGNLVKIRHANGIETRYAHMSKIHVKVGDKVSRGDRIGDMGNTGRSTGTHLHYEVRVSGEPVDPMTFIKAGKDVF